MTEGPTSGTLIGPDDDWQFCWTKKVLRRNTTGVTNVWMESRSAPVAFLVAVADETLGPDTHWRRAYAVTEPYVGEGYIRRSLAWRVRMKIEERR